LSALKSVALAIQLAKVKRDAIVLQLNRFKRSQANARDQMVQLSSYSDETYEKWILASNVGVSPEIMRHQNQFMARLQEAIALQQTVINNSDADVLRAHKNFMASELKLASLEHMQKKLLSRLDSVNTRKAQKQTDEFAATKKATVFDTI